MSLAIWAVVCLPLQAQFSDLYVFGDSLSDVGNLSAATLGFLPGSDYFDGRYSNGPVYAELLAEKLGLEPLRRSGEGGNNFAYGGASTSGTSFLEGWHRGVSAGWNASTGKARTQNFNADLGVHREAERYRG